MRQKYLIPSALAVVVMLAASSLLPAANFLPAANATPSATTYTLEGLSLRNTCNPNCADYSPGVSFGWAEDDWWPAKLTINTGSEDSACSTSTCSITIDLDYRFSKPNVGVIYGIDAFASCAGAAPVGGLTVADQCGSGPTPSSGTIDNVLVNGVGTPTSFSVVSSNNFNKPYIGEADQAIAFTLTVGPFGANTDNAIEWASHLAVTGQCTMQDNCGNTAGDKDSAHAADTLGASHWTGARLHMNSDLASVTPGVRDVPIKVSPKQECTENCGPIHTPGTTGTDTIVILEPDTPLVISPIPEIPLGSVVHDTATVSISTPPTNDGVDDTSAVSSGILEYRFYTGSDCLVDNFVDSQQVSLNVDGTVPDSSQRGPMAVGTYSYQGEYFGDDNFDGSVSVCEPFSVVKATPGFVTQVLNAAGTDITGTTISAGTTVHDTATLSGQVNSFSFNDGANVVYSFFTNGGCTDNPASTEQVSVNSDGTVPDSSSRTINFAGDYSYLATYSGNDNYNSKTADCEPFHVSEIPGTVTDTQLCPLGTNPINLIYVQDTSSTFMLKASNPGQFYYNVFKTSNVAIPPGTTITVTIPYPFVTQGANPIQVFLNQPLPTCHSTVPSTNINNQFTISPTSSTGAINLASYIPQQIGSTKTVTFTTTSTIPANSLLWFAIHLDYGLKGKDFTKVPLNTAPCTGANIGDCAQSYGLTPTVTIKNLQSYTFSNNQSPSSTIFSKNTFKKDPGFAGIVTSSTTGNPIQNVKIVITINTKPVTTATVYTDQDGVYSYAYKYTGSAVSYTIKATYGIITKTVTGTMKSNTMILTDFQFP